MKNTIRLLILFFCFFCSPLALAQMPTDKPINPLVEDFAYIRNDALWTELPISVCWENPTGSEFAEEGRRLVRQGIAETWEKESALRFSGWGPCTPASRGIRIVIADDGPHVKGLGRQLDGMKNGMLLNFSFNNWSREYCKADREKWKECVRNIAIHEFGHAIGFAHEHNRADTPEWCTKEKQGTNGTRAIGEWDPDSVMNYCNKAWNGLGKLSWLDIQAVRIIYGPRSNTQ